MHLLAIALYFALTACAPPTKQELVLAHAFVGCWESADGLAREVWNMDPSGWLFGYALNRNTDGKITFFEHMRIENTDGMQMLIVLGADSTTVGFARAKTKDSREFRFENPAHDFPQIIRYQRADKQLNAVISKLDGSSEIRFDKTACQ
ncbi:MAG: hypothetical protein COA91_08375 [Robiginitomaculum sp.]|nr:MAG: hypothetical protein COA91_08375 [Robiginitomaculum sp.]